MKPVNLAVEIGDSRNYIRFHSHLRTFKFFSKFLREFKMGVLSNNMNNRNILDINVCENIYIIVNVQEKYSHSMLYYRVLNICHSLLSGLLL